jgi:hypothetical protein
MDCKKKRQVARNPEGSPVLAARVPEGDPLGIPPDRDEGPATIEPGEVLQPLTCIEELAHCVL